MPEPRCCEFCRTALVQHDGELRWSFTRRRFCSHAHATYWRLNEGRPAEPGDRRLVPPAEVTHAPVQFPGARYERVDDVPPFCSCGGPWHYVPGAVACTQCSKQHYVVEWLREAIHLLVPGSSTSDEATRFLAPYGPGSGNSRGGSVQ